MALLLGNNVATGEPIEVEEADTDLLRRHVAILGASGSGKTVAAKVLLEEAVLAGVPSVVIDPQGDLGRLALLGDAAALEEQGGDPARQETYMAKAEVRIWTPTETYGLPLCIDPFASNPTNIHPTTDDERKAFIAAVNMMATGFASIAGYAGHRREAQVKAFLNELLKMAVKAEDVPVGFQALAELVKDPAEALERWGRADQLETLRTGYLKKSEMEELSQRIRVLSTGINQLMFANGAPLDVDLMRTPIEEGRTPVNIVLLKAINGEAEKQNFLLEVSRAIYTWMLQQSGDDLNLVYFIDEVSDFLPPHPKNPPAKDTVKNLFKQGRKYGVSCVLASQNLKDVDYKILSQAKTVFLGGVADSREREHVAEMLPARTRKEDAERLGGFAPGEFFFVNEGISTRPLRMTTRWLYSEHGPPLSDAEIRALSEDQRAWAKAQSSTSRAMEAAGPRQASQTTLADEEEPTEALDEDDTDAAEVRLEEDVPEEVEVSLLGGVSVLRDSNDPMQVMFGMTNLVTAMCFLIVSLQLMDAWRAEHIGVAMPLLGLSVTLLCFGVMIAETLLNDEREILQRFRRQSRPLQAMVLLWAWILVVAPSVFADLEYNAAAHAAALSAQALTTVFLLADLGHRLQLRSLDIEFGTSVLQTAKSSAKAILNMPQFRRIITSSQHVVRNIRLIVDLGVIYVLLVVWGFVPEFGVLPVEETGIRIAAVIAVIFLTEVRTRRRTTWTDA